jgi:glycine/D-amino acid oxidase-like deaminating enzyme
MVARELGTADVAVIGGGLMGTAAALFLARGGLDVVLLERRELNREASGTNAGSLHLQIYVHPTFPADYIERIRPSVPLLREAALGWASVEDDLGEDCGVRLGGGMWIAESAEDMALIEAKVRVENEMGVASEILSRTDLHEFAPYLSDAIIGGSVLRGEGFANPLLVTGAYERAATAAGARFVTGVEVRSVTARAAGGFEVETDSGSLTAARVISAVGAWTPQITAMVGLEIPVNAGVAQVNVTEARPPIMRGQLIQHISRGLTLKQSPQDTFIIGGGWPGAYERTTQRKLATFDSMVGNAWVAARTVPALAGAEIVRSWGGMGSWTDDGLPIIGPSQQVPGFHVLYSALGFSLGPASARVLSEQVLTGEASIPIAAFSPDRFTGSAS